MKKEKPKTIALNELWQNENIPLATKIEKSIAAEDYSYLSNLNFFLNLRAEDKLLVAYFTGSNEDLQVILKNNFPNINEHLGNFIAYLYTEVKDFAKRKFFLMMFQKEPNFFSKLNDLSYTCFKKINNTLAFFQKYQNQPLVKEVLNADERTIYEYGEELFFLSRHKPIPEIKSLQDLKQYSISELEDFAAIVEDNFRETELYSPENYHSINFFKYSLEVLIIKTNGEVRELPIDDQNPRHFFVLEDAYQDVLCLANLNEFQASCEINNKLGEIVWLIENAGISIFYPKSITEEQLNSSLQLLVKMQKSSLKFEIRGGITTNKGYFGMYMFNDGEDITISEIISEVSKIPLNNSLKIENNQKHF